MNLEKIANEKVLEGADASNYLPFAVAYLETPNPQTYNSADVLAITSVTFCTFKFIPLIDDED